MSFVNEETKRQIESITGNVREFAALVDEKNTSVKIPGLDCVVGLDMPAEAKIFYSLCDDIEDGVFKTLVMGKFKNGKSTFINALVGKVMMAARATACTAVIATVEYGQRTEEVDIYYADQEKPRTVSLEQFTREFALTDADQELIENGGNFDRFADVSHVEIQSNDSIFADGLRLIDSPGLEEANARTRTTTEFVPKANAIIFTMSAPSLFSAKEKEYIAENFAGKGLRNVFFVVNRIDNVIPGQLEASVIPGVRAGLEEVFTDGSGFFDEELYNRRVFFTNAYGALCLRTGEEYKVMAGRKEIPVPLGMEDTGMLEFESALREFLNSKERIHATFSSTLTNMANTYQAAAKKVETDIAARSGDAQERKRRSQLAGEKLNEALEKVNETKRIISRYAEMIAKTVYFDLMNYVQSDLVREFVAASQKPEMQAKFNMGSMLQLAGATVASKLPIDKLRKSADEKQQKVMQPFVDNINHYITSHLTEDWPKRIPTLTARDCDDLQKELDSQRNAIDISLNEALNLFAYGNAKAPASEGNTARMGVQSVITLLNWDFSNLVTGSVNGGFSWGDFIKRMAVQLVLDQAVALVLGAPFIWACLLVEVFSLGHDAKKMSGQLMSKIGEKALTEVAKKISEQDTEIKSSVMREIEKQCAPSVQMAQDIVKEQEANMHRILKENADDKAASEAENARITKNLAAMRERINAVYEELYSHTPNEAEFENLGRNRKVN